jgi:Flp pilus assembly pilin Flp
VGRERCWSAFWWECCPGCTGGRGQALGEYALVIALVVLAAVASLSALGMAVGGFLDDFAGKLDSLIS